MNNPILNYPPFDRYLERTFRLSFLLKLKPPRKQITSKDIKKIGIKKSPFKEGVIIYPYYRAGNIEYLFFINNKLVVYYLKRVGLRTVQDKVNIYVKHIEKWLIDLKKINHIFHNIDVEIEPEKTEVKSPKSRPNPIKENAKHTLQNMIKNNVSRHDIINMDNAIKIDDNDTMLAITRRYK